MITLKQFELVMRGTIDKRIKRSLMVLGPTGIGKSEIIHQVADLYGIKVIDVRLLLWSLTDLKGIPYPDETGAYTRWLINDVLPRVDRDGEAGILLLEELNAASRNVQAAAYQLTLDRKIGDYILPDEWIIIATGNREQDSGVYVAPPAPLADRFEIQEIEPDFATWRDYAIKAGVHPMVVAYLSFNPKALYTFNPEDSAEMVFATPRSWVVVSDILHAGFSNNLLRIKIEGNVGAVEAASFSKYHRNKSRLPDLASVLDGSILNKSEGAEYCADIDAYFLLVQNLIFAVNSEFANESSNWRTYVDNSADFITTINDFPLDLKKSYVDQLCEIQIDIRKYVYSKSRSRGLSKLFQEIDYIK
jgi:hypothetical protein